MEEDAPKDAEYIDSCSYIFNTFPDYNENHLGALELAPTGKMYFGSLYDDLFGYSGTNPLLPSLTNPDPYLQFVFNLRSTFSYLLQVRLCTTLSVEDGLGFDIIQTAKAKFINLYSMYSAIRIQRFFRAHRKGASKTDKAKFALTYYTRIVASPNAEETSLRGNLLEELLNTP